MTKSLIYSLVFHSIMILLTILSLPFMIRQPIDLPPIVSVELIQISDKTNIPFAPKAREIIKEAKNLGIKINFSYGVINTDGYLKVSSATIGKLNKEKSDYNRYKHALSV
mgnify:CR=1 FL=1